ncbi:MAG: amidohydrolase family protein [Ilumatobacteraceae bacterium]
MGDTAGPTRRRSVLRGAVRADGSAADVSILDGAIEAVGHVAARPGDDVVDLDGHVLLTAAVEPHAHLDKAFLAELLPNDDGDLLGAIAAMVAGRPQLGVDETVVRAERAARLLATNGFTAVRTHADTTLDHGLRSIEALVEVRRRVADVIDVEIVALCGWPVTGPGGEPQRALLRDALAIGADVVGGCPHLDDGGTRAATEVYLQIAAEHGVGVDLHTDETLDASVDGLGELAAVVSATGFDLPVTASHCVSLGMKSTDQQRAIAEAVAAAGIAVVALPATNLFLQGRGHQQAMPRGLTAVKALRNAGVVVAAGADNLQDPFNPLGRACPFETAGLMVWTAHLSPADAWACVTDMAARALGRAPLAIAAGAPADLVAVPVASLREAIASGAPRRTVWHHGHRV